MEVLDLWLEKCWREKAAPTWHAVSEILSLIGHQKMADDILQVYTTGDHVLLLFLIKLFYSMLTNS